MKILFTADWHINLRHSNVPEEWARNRYDSFFSQILDIENSVECHIIGGDIFDRLPNLEELEIYFQFISQATIPTIIYDGNHEATKKGKTFLSSLASVTKAINPLVDVVTETRHYEKFQILPYCDLHKKTWDLLDHLPVFTHVRGEIPPHVKPEVPLERFDKYPVVYAGDLHSKTNSQRNIVYPGSPMTISFHRNEVETGYIIIDIDSLTHTWHKFELPQLIRLTVSDPDQMVPTKYHHTIYELTGDVKSLASVDNNALLDKKIINRATEVSLILDSGMSLVDELVEYLKYVLELDQKQIDEIVKTYYDYTKNSEVE